MATPALSDRVRLLPRPVRLHEEEPVKLRVCRACRRAHPAVAAVCRASA